MTIKTVIERLSSNTYHKDF